MRKRGFVPKDAGVPIQPDQLQEKLENDSFVGMKAKPFIDRQGDLTYQIKV